MRASVLPLRAPPERPILLERQQRHPHGGRGDQEKQRPDERQRRGQAEQQSDHRRGLTWLYRESSSSSGDVCKGRILSGEKALGRVAVTFVAPGFAGDWI